MARRGALVAALLFCMALGAFAGSSYNAYWGKYPSLEYRPTYDAGKLPKGVSYTTNVYPTCPGKQANNDLIYAVKVCAFEGIVTGVSYYTSNKGYETSYDMCMVDEPELSGPAGSYMEDAYTYMTKAGEELRKGGVKVAAGAAVDGPDGEEGDLPAGWECKTRVMCEGEVITRTQVYRIRVDTPKGPQWAISDLMFYTSKNGQQGGYVWGYGMDSYFEMSQEEYVLKMSMSNQAARKGTKKMVCGAAGFLKPKCNDYGLLSDLRTCGKCVKPAKYGYAGYIAPNSKYYADDAPSKFTEEEGVYYCYDMEKDDGEGDSDDGDVIPAPAAPSKP